MADPTTTYEKGQFYKISIIDFKPDPNQPRKYMDPQGLEDLAASLTRNGILQPLLFRVEEGNPYLIIVAGERRYAAAKIAGLLVIPAICVEGNTAEIALVENLQRQDLTPVEEGEALGRLKDEQQYTDEQLSGVIGKARTTINESLLLNKLPQEIRDECRGNNKFIKSALVEIARKKQDRSMITAFNTLKDKLGKVRQPRQKTDPNEPQAFLVLLEKTGAKLDAIDTSAWTADDHNSLGITLTALRDKIDTRLAAAPQASPSTALA